MNALQIEYFSKLSYLTIIDDIFKAAKTHSCSIIYPEDVVVGKGLKDKAQIKELSEVKNNDKNYIKKLLMGEGYLETAHRISLL